MSRRECDELDELRWPTEIDPFGESAEDPFQPLFDAYERALARAKAAEGERDFHQGQARKFHGSAEFWRRQAVAWRRLAVVLGVATGFLFAWVMLR